MTQYETMRDLLEHDRANTVREYFDSIWKDSGGKVFLTLRNPHNQSWTEHPFQWPDNADEAVEFVKSNYKDYDVYVAPAMFNENASRRSPDQVQGSHVLWADLDDNSVKNALDRLHDFGAMVVQSGSDDHYHGYLLLDRPVDGEELAKLNKVLAYKFGGDSKHAANTVLRVPGTLNHKTENPKEVDFNHQVKDYDLETGDYIFSEPKVWSLASLRMIFQSTTEIVEQSEQIDITPEPVKDIPKTVAEIFDLSVEQVNELYEEKRSGAIYALVSTALDEGMTPNQIAYLLTKWSVSRTKLKTDERIIEDLKRIIAKIGYTPSEGTGFKILTEEDLENYQQASFLIEDVLPQHGITAITGDPGSGKSFVALDMALSVSRGRPWSGHPVRQGRVMYVGLEGSYGLAMRVRAWSQMNDGGAKSQNSGFYFGSAELKDFGQRQALIDAVTEFKPDLIVMDTLARAAAGYNENDAGEMSQFINHCDQIRRASENSTMIIVHHSDKGGMDKFGSRGSSALSGAFDAMFKISKKNNEITVKCTKQKDLEETPPHVFHLKPIDLGLTNDFGNKIAPCAVPVSKDELNAKKQLFRRIEKIYHTMRDQGSFDTRYQILRNHVGLNGKQVKEEYAESWDWLVDYGIIVQDGSKFRLADDYETLWTSALLDMGAEEEREEDDEDADV